MALSEKQLSSILSKLSDEYLHLGELMNRLKAMRPKEDDARAQLASEKKLLQKKMKKLFKIMTAAEEYSDM